MKSKPNKGVRLGMLTGVSDMDYYGLRTARARRTTRKHRHHPEVGNRRLVRR